MSAYFIARCRVTSPKGESDYRIAVEALAGQFGGRFVTQVCGSDVLKSCDDGVRLVVYEFSNESAVQCFLDSSGYADLKKLRAGAGELDVWAVPA